MLGTNGQVPPFVDAKPSPLFWLAPLLPSSCSQLQLIYLFQSALLLSPPSSSHDYSSALGHCSKNLILTAFSIHLQFDTVLVVLPLPRLSRSTPPALLPSDLHSPPLPGNSFLAPSTSSPYYRHITSPLACTLPVPPYHLHLASPRFEQPFDYLRPFASYGRQHFLLTRQSRRAHLALKFTFKRFCLLV